MTSHSFDDVVRTAMAGAIPLTAHVMVTEQCDLKCRHCYLPSRRQRDSLSLDEFDDILGQLREAGTLFITLSGGECLLHPDFFAMARLVRDHGLALRVYTNGHGIDRETAHRLAGLHPVEVDVSLYGADAGTHDDITGVPGSFDRAVRAIRHLVGLGVRTQVKAPLMRANFDQCEGLQDLARSLEAGFHASPYLYPPQGDQARCDAMTCSGVELEDVFAVLEPGGPEVPATRSTEAAGLCGAGNNYVAIGPDASVYPCPMFHESVGNLREQRFKDIWKGARLLVDLRTLTPGDLVDCRDCADRHLCNRCIAAVHAATRTLDRPDEQACRIARIRRPGHKRHPT